MSTVGRVRVGLAITATCLISARRADQETQASHLLEEKAREAVATWVANTSPLQYRIAALSAAQSEGLRLRGTLLAAEDDICLFRCSAIEWLVGPEAEDADARSAAAPSNTVPQVAMTTFDGSELPERGLPEVADFYKHGSKLLIWSKDQTWEEMALDAIHPPPKKANQQKKLFSIVGNDDVSDDVYRAIDNLAFAEDPRTLFADTEIQKNGIVVDKPATSHGADHELRMQLSPESVRQISPTSRQLVENGAPIPGFPERDGEIVDNEVLFGLSTDLRVIDVTIRMVHHFYWDLDHPKDEIRSVEIFDFVPEQNGVCGRVPESIHQALGAEHSAPRNVDAWADVLLATPDETSVPDPDARKEILSIGLPWKVRHRSSGMTMVLVPPGEFDMGSPESSGQRDEHPKHRVRISRPLYVGQFEVTQEEYERVVGSNPSIEWVGMGPTLPVNGASLEDISKRGGFLDRTGLRLLTEAEWEYVARGRGDVNYPWGDTADKDNANYDIPKKFSDAILSGSSGSNRGPQLRPVGSSSRDASWCGVHDLAGNVAEMCFDIYDSRIYEAYSRSRVTVDPSGPRFDIRQPHVSRGGSLMSLLDDIRCTRRNRCQPTVRGPAYGFRCARNP